MPSHSKAEAQERTITCSENPQNLPLVLLVRRCVSSWSESPCHQTYACLQSVSQSISESVSAPQLLITNVFVRTNMHHQFLELLCVRTNVYKKNPLAQGLCHFCQSWQSVCGGKGICRKGKAKWSSLSLHFQCSQKRGKVTKTESHVPPPNRLLKGFDFDRLLLSAFSHESIIGEL